MSRSDSLPPVAVDALLSVHQHRALTARQLQALHAPSNSLRWMQMALARLVAHGLLDSVRVDRGRQLFFVTAAGADAVALVGSRAETRRMVMRPEQAAGPLRRHTHGVNDTGIAFVAAARERGDACGPWAWRHEIAHPIGHLPGQQRSEQLVSDALLTYEHHADEQLSFHYRLIELDRATMSVDDLAAKLSRYVRLHRHTVAPGEEDDPVPAWTYRYSVFPRVLVVLANGTSPVLARRRGTLLALCREDQDLREGREVRIDVCLLEELRVLGPFAPIFRTVEDPDTSVTWLGAR
jgi:Replication-relaxation